MTVIIYTRRLRNLCDLFYNSGVEPNVQYIQGGPVLLLIKFYAKDSILDLCLENTFLTVKEI